MKRLLLAAVLLGLGITPALAQTVPELPFESVPNPLKLPNDIHFGEIAGVAVNSYGHVFVFSRGNSVGPAYMATASQLLEFDAQGNFVHVRPPSELFSQDALALYEQVRRDQSKALAQGADTSVPLYAKT